MQGKQNTLKSKCQNFQYFNACCQSQEIFPLRLRC